MNFGEFKNTVVSNYNSVFPRSMCSIDIGMLGRDSFFVTYYLAGDKSEFPNNIAQNDIFDISFYIKTFTDLEDDTELPDKMGLEVTEKNIMTKPHNEYMAYGRVTLPFRKITGTPEKVIDTLKKYAEVTKNTLTELYNTEQLPVGQQPNIVGLVADKLGISNKEGGNTEMKENKKVESKVADLPDICYAVLPSDCSIIIIKKGEKGYYLTNKNYEREYADVTDYDERLKKAQEICNRLNNELGITQAQSDEMAIRSMNGNWKDTKTEGKLQEDEETSKYKQKFIDYCKDKIDNLGTVKVLNDEYDEEDDDEEDKYIEYKIMMIEPEFREASPAYILQAEEGGLMVCDTKGNIVLDDCGDMYSTVAEAQEMKFTKIDKEFYDELLEYWDEYEFDYALELDEITQASEEKIKREFKCPPPFNYNVIHRAGGADVEVYCTKCRDLNATTTTMKGDKHVQEYFDIDGLWQVNEVDNNGKWVKYVYVTGWQEAMKMLQDQLAKLNNAKTESKLQEDDEEELVDVDNEEDENEDEVDADYTLETFGDTSGFHQFVLDTLEDAILDYDDDLTKVEKIKKRCQSVLDSGCVSGIVPELIYYSDTTKVFDDYADDIYDIIEEYDPEAFLDLLKGRVNTTEIILNCDTSKNWIVWIAYEELVYRLESALEEIS